MNRKKSGGIITAIGFLGFFICFISFALNGMSFNTDGVITSFVFAGISMMVMVVGGVVSASRPHHFDGDSNPYVRHTDSENHNVKYCPDCGAQNNKSANFCQQCGKDLF